METQVQTPMELAIKNVDLVGKTALDTITVESQLTLSDVNMYKHRFEDLEPGIYKLDYICPLYTMTLTVSWDGVRLV